MNNPRSLFVALLLAFISGAVFAQEAEENLRDRIFSELRPYKHQVLARELQLSKEQQREFFAVYDEMEDRLQQISTETRDLEKKVNSDKNATDTEIEAAANAVYSQKEREGKVEMEYFDRFKEILTPRQLLRLRTAEKSFTQRLVKHHRNHKDGAIKQNKPTDKKD